jgi:predicted RNA-binding Zn-ribbon protein involved in translation (DUF1610 family)
MIVMGSKDRTIDLGEGRFYCPNCGVVRMYIRRRSARYFTLYFIPVFQVENKGEFVECKTCGFIYPPEALEGQHTFWGERTTLTIRTNLESGMPIHMMMRKLVGDGFNAELAFHNVWAVMGETAKTCPSCRFTYHRSVERCANCGLALETVRRDQILNRLNG